MKYWYLIGGIIFFLIFSWDIENDRDFYTWLWMLYSILWFIMFIKGCIEEKQQSN